VSLLHKATSRWACSLDFGFAITLFGYQIGFSFDITEWHIMFDHFEGVGYLIYFGPIAFDILDATKYKERPSERDLLCATILENYGKVSTELAQEKTAHLQDIARLAACGATAEGWGEELDPVNPKYSDAHKKTLILLVKYKQALKEIEKLRNKLGGKNGKNKSLSTRKSNRKR